MGDLDGPEFGEVWLAAEVATYEVGSAPPVEAYAFMESPTEHDRGQYPHLPPPPYAALQNSSFVTGSQFTGPIN